MTFKLNMTDKEAESKDFEFPPTGKYTCRITNLELDEVKKQGDNFGKPYWKLTLTVDEGPYAGTTIPTTVMLFSPALFTLKQLCLAVHPEYVDGKEIKLPSVEGGTMPSPDPWLGQVVRIKGTKYAAGTQDKNARMREFDEFRVVFQKADENGSKSASGGLPMPS